MAGTSATAAEAPPVVADTWDDPAASAPFLDEDTIIEGSAAWKPLFACFSETRSCGRRGPARLGSTQPRSSSMVSGVDRLGIARLAEHPLRPRVGLDQRDLRFLAAAEPQVIERHHVDREDRDRRAVLGHMLPSVARSAMVRSASPGPKNSTNFPTTPCLRRRSVIVSTRSVAVAPSSIAPVSLKPRTCGISIEIGWPSIAASASMPPTPQPITPSPFTIVVCESVPTSVSGKQTRPSGAVVGHDHAREILEVDLMDDAGVGRHDAEVVERVLAPAEEGVALLVARELELRVQLEGIGLGEVIDLHRMVDDELDRLQRVDAVGIAAEPGDAVAHGREIDHRRNAGEILEQHARRSKRDLPLGRALHVPFRQRLDVGGLHEPAVFVAQQIFEQDFHRVRKPGDFAEPGALKRGQAVNQVGAIAHDERDACAEAVDGRHLTIVPRSAVTSAPPATRLRPSRAPGQARTEPQIVREMQELADCPASDRQILQISRYFRAHTAQYW